MLSASELAPAPYGVFDHLSALGDRPRFIWSEGGEKRVMTWNEFADRIRQIALVLAEEGIRRADAVCVLGSNSVDWAAAALGIQTAGAVMVPIYPSSTPEQIAFIVRHCEAKCVFVDSADRPLDPAVRRIFLGDRAVYARGAALHRDDPDRVSRLLASVALDDVGLMLYTSGTSGNPKGVPLTHRNVAVNGRDWLEVNHGAFGDEDVDLLWLPMSHIFGLGELCQGNQLGWTSYLSSPKEVMTDLPKVAPTVFFSVPAYWEKIARACGTGPDPDRFAEVTGGRIRFAMSGGAGLGIELKELFARAGLTLIEGYGLTECSPTLTLNSIHGYRFDSVGRPFPSVELQLGPDGEILARGDNVFSGYYRDPEATAAAFDQDGWFHTGDLGRFTDDGFLQIIGRKKEILVTAGGKNIPPSNIEMRFADDPVIEHLVVYGDGKKFLVAGVWVSPATPLAEREERVAERIAAVNQTLASFETIKKWTIIDEPLTPENGLVTASLKLRRKHIYEAFRDRFESLYSEAR